MSQPTTITRSKAERHAALYLRLAALVRQADAVARRRPSEPVPDPVLALAEGALFDARAFRRAQKGPLTAAAPHYGALAAQLAEALAELVTWETRHSHWDEHLGLVVWDAGLPPLPVRRLAPRTARKPTKPLADMPRRDITELRAKLVQRIEQFNRR